MEKTQNFSENRVFTTNGAKEELQSPSFNYFMNRTETQRLKAYYITALDVPANQLMVILLFSLFFILILLIYYLYYLFKVSNKFCPKVWETSNRTWTNN